MSDNQNQGNAIAVIGMSGSFPGAANIDEFWSNLENGVESIKFFSDKELKGKIPDALLQRPDYVKAWGVLNDIDKFDAKFFGLNPRDSELMDPQHRLFLETSYTALEHAGYDPERYEGLIGVFAGCDANTYYENVSAKGNLSPAEEGVRLLIGNEKDFLATRVSYKLNLKGPALNIQSACSTSLVAVHTAYQNLLNYNCDIALAGGVSVHAPNETGYIYRENGILSPDGHCRAFDADAQGCICGNGAGVVVLKRLTDALEDGDFIHGVILGAAVNNDGSQKVAFTAPGVQGQEEVIATAHALADIKAETITYMEAHGTGTKLGDPVEIAALTRAFGDTPQKEYCAIGSVKTNIGHLNSGAGVAGLIKTVLALKHKTIPPSLNFKAPNPNIDFKNSPFYVSTNTQKWETNGIPRRAGVSSFGIGGTNAHAVLEEAPALEPEERVNGDELQVLCLSAKTPSALETQSRNLSEHLKANPEINISDVACTLQLGRKQLEYRKTIVCRNVKEAIVALEEPTETQKASNPSPVFLFPGHGAQYPNMAVDLYKEEEVFRTTVDQCCDILQNHLDLDLRTILYPEAGNLESAGKSLGQTHLALPALFVVEYAVAKLLQSRGIECEAMIGHSNGEYTAACLSGVLSLEDCLELLAIRSRLLGQLPQGAMLTVFLSQEELAPYKIDSLSQATDAPGCTVLSGPVEAIEELQAQLKKAGVEFRRLNSPVAFHSWMTEDILNEFTNSIRKFQFSAPQIPFISNVSGTWITADEATDPEYWARHIRQTVRLTTGLEELLKEPNRVFLEVGPGRTLNSFLRQHPNLGENQILLSSLRSRSAREKQPETNDCEYFLDSLGKLWESGLQLDWESFWGVETRRRIPLPTYPFERESYWIQPAEPSSEALFHTAKPETSNNAPVQIPVWKQSAQIPDKTSERDLKSIWLLFSEASGPGDALGERLLQEGQTIIQVHPGEQYKKIQENTYQLNPEVSQDYITLIDELQSLKKMPQEIVYLWSLNSSSPESTHFTAIHRLTGALEKYNLTIRIRVISNNALEISGTETFSPGTATLPGLRDFRDKHMNGLRCSLIDLNRSGTSTDRKLVEQLTFELRSQASEDVVAYRGNGRWTQVYEPAQTAGKVSLKSGGNYLIMGEISRGAALGNYLKQITPVNTVLLTHAEQRLEMDPEQQEEELRICNLEQKVLDELKIKTRAAFPGFGKDLDQLCVSYVYAYFSDFIDTNQGCVYSTQSLQTNLGILPEFTKYYTCFLDMLREDNIISLKNDSVEFLKKPEEVRTTQDFKTEMLLKYPEFKELFSFLEHCVFSYGESLTGKKSHIEVLRPDGDDRPIREFHDSILLHDSGQIFVKLAKEIIIDVATRSAGKTIRILEFGSGMGAFTWPMMEALKNQNVEYHFTDIGQLFVMRAQEEAQKRGYTSMRFSRFDITKSPLEQEPDLGAYDIIIGYNVAQVGPRLKDNVKNLEELLAPGGLMLLPQLFEIERWHHLIFGLQPGWWDYDDDLRTDSLFIDRHQWEAAIRERNFDRVNIFPQNQDEGQIRDNGLIVARKSTELNNTLITNPGGGKQISLDSSFSAAGISEKISDAIRRIQNEIGKIDGVIYASDPTSNESSQDITASFEKRSESRIKNLEILTKSFKEQEPDFFLLLTEIETKGINASESGLCELTDAFALKQNRTDVSHWMHVRLKRNIKTMGLETFRLLISINATCVLVGEAQTDEENETDVQADVGPETVRTQKSAPKNSVVSRVTGLWKKSLGLKQIKLTDNFFDIGGDSLVAIHLLAKVRDEFGIRVSMPEFSENPTILHMVELVGPDEKLNGDEARALPGRPKCLISIQTRGTKRPCFFVHPSGGSPLCYSNLARQLGADQPFYGFQSRGLQDDLEPLTRVEDMAALYISEMRTVQAHGPYILGGWSGGGVVAFEMARQLEEQGESIELLAMLDSGLENTDGQQRGKSTWGVVSALAQLSALVLDITPPTNYDDLKQFGEWAGVNLPESFQDIMKKDFFSKLNFLGNLTVEVPRFIPLYKSNFMATLDYIPGPYNGRAVVFRTTRGPISDTDPVVSSLKKVSAGGVEVRQVPGNHMTMLDRANVTVLADQLKEFLVK